MTKENKRTVAALSGLTLMLAISIGMGYYAFYSGGMVGLLTLAPMLFYFAAIVVYLRPQKSLGYAALVVSIVSYFAFFGFTSGIPYGVTYTVLNEIVAISTSKYLKKEKTA